MIYFPQKQTYIHLIRRWQTNLQDGGMAASNFYQQNAHIITILHTI